MININNCSFGVVWFIFIYTGCCLKRIIEPNQSLSCFHIPKAFLSSSYLFSMAHGISCAPLGITWLGWCSQNRNIHAHSRRSSATTGNIYIDFSLPNDSSVWHSSHCHGVSFFLDFFWAFFLLCVSFAFWRCRSRGRSLTFWTWFEWLKSKQFSRNALEQNVNEDRKYKDTSSNYIQFLLLIVSAIFFFPAQAEVETQQVSIEKNYVPWKYWLVAVGIQ